MNYPEKGAKYRNEPAWMERAKKAEGGSVGDDQTPYKVAGDVVRFSQPADDEPYDQMKEVLNKQNTIGTLNRALGVKAKVLPIKPEK